MANNLTTITVDGYGTFKAKMRDMWTDMRISCRTDELIAGQQFDPNHASAYTRNLFTAMATFFETVEEGGSPEGFDAGELMRGDPQAGWAFFFEYGKALGETEARFRNGVQKVVSRDGVGNGTDPTVEGTQNSTVG